MKPLIFKGSAVALVTPMKDDFSVNYEELDRLLDFHLENRTDAVVAVGTTGESATLTDEEHIGVIAFCVRKLHGRLPVIAGAGSNSTAHAVELSKAAADAGADALLHVTPYYNKTSQKGLYLHFRACAEATKLPVILYNVPTRTGMNILPETYFKLSQIENIVAAKEASGNFSLLSHTRALCGDDFHIWSGNDDQTVPMMALGAKGVISVVANVAPKLMVDMTHLCLAGDYASASKLQIENMDFIDSLFLEVNPIPVKAAMNLIGMEAGGLRLPLCDMSESNLEKMKAAMARIGLLR